MLFGDKKCTKFQLHSIIVETVQSGPSGGQTANRGAMGLKHHVASMKRWSKLIQNMFDTMWKKGSVSAIVKKEDFFF